VRPELPGDVSTHRRTFSAIRRANEMSQFNFRFDARHGLIQKLSMRSASSAEEQTLPSLGDIKIYDVEDWADQLRAGGLDTSSAAGIGSWLNGLFGVYSSSGEK